MNMSIPNLNCASGFSTEFMKVIFIKIGPEFYLMNMIASADRNRLPGYCCKPMIVRIFFRLRNSNAALDFMDMPLHFISLILFG